MKHDFGPILKTQKIEILELKEELSKNYKFKTKSDTELVVAAYQTWGIQMLEKFNGMFSFALWDKLNQEFYLCRDRLGIKPLYYLEENESIIFSSSLKAIKLFKYQELSINKDDIIDFLSFGTVHSPNTFIDEIKLIPRAWELINIRIDNQIFSELKKLLNQNFKKELNAN